MDQQRENARRADRVGQVPLFRSANVLWMSNRDVRLLARADGGARSDDNAGTLALGGGDEPL